MKAEWVAAEQFRQQATEAKNSGNLEAAKILLDKARNAEPNHPWVIHDWIYLMLAMGDAERAEEALPTLESLLPRSPQAQLARVRVLLALGHESA